MDGTAHIITVNSTVSALLQNFQHFQNSTDSGVLPASSDDGGKSKIFSDFTRLLFEVIVQICLNGAVSVVGIAANVVNLMVFVRQGVLGDSVTASLTGLAVADLCCLITMLWHSVNFAIMLSPPPGLPWDPMSVLYVTGGWPHVMFTRVTCWITAYVAFERCMCVLLPFKVRELFTARRSIAIIVAIFIVLISSYIPIFYTHRLQNVRNPHTNVTKISLVFTSNKDQIERICHYFNDVIMPTISLSIVILCTRLTVSRLHASTKWRKRNATSDYALSKNDDSGNKENAETVKTSAVNTQSPNHQKGGKESAQPMASKETKVVRMITLICTLFIICNSPCIVIIYLRFIEPDIANMGTYHNLFHILYSIDFFLESFNSSVNILVYYSMSSRYKQEFRKLFRLQEL